MSSHEESNFLEYKGDPKSFREERLNIPTLKYFWQASPLSTDKQKSIPKFLRAIKIFDTFSDYELKKFSGFLHKRSFEDDEVVIEEGDSGFGFYIIFSGSVEIFSKRSRLNENSHETYQQFITGLRRYEYFGELALLEKQNIRNATVVSKGNLVVLAIYKPDIEELIDRHPVIGAKFLQGISLIVAQRFNQATEELRVLKDKVKELESRSEKPDPQA